MASSDTLHTQSAGKKVHKRVCLLLTHSVQVNTASIYLLYLCSAVFSLCFAVVCDEDECA